MKFVSDRPTLTRQRLVRAIGQRTRQPNHAVEVMLEALIQLVSDQLAEGGRLELENFITLDIMCRKRLATEQAFWNDRLSTDTPFHKVCTLRCRPSKHLRARLKALSAR